MNRLLVFAIAITLQLSLLTTSVSAQYFSFGDPFSTQRVRTQQEEITPPKYKGGNTALNKYLEKEFRNPASRKMLDGKITVALFLNTKGKVEDAKLVQGVEETLNLEALRVARKLKFSPAKQGKKKMKSRFDVVFPIRHGRLSFIDLPTIEV